MRSVVGPNQLDRMLTPLDKLDDRLEEHKIDKLLESGRKESDQEKREKIYFDFQRYLVEDAPAVFLFHPTTYTISR